MEAELQTRLCDASIAGSGSSTLWVWAAWQAQDWRLALRTVLILSRGNAHPLNCPYTLIDTMPTNHQSKPSLTITQMRLREVSSSNGAAFSRYLMRPAAPLSWCICGHRSSAQCRLSARSRRSPAADASVRFGVIKPFVILFATAYVGPIRSFAMSAKEQGCSNRHRVYDAYCLPVIGNDVPVTAPASRESRNATTGAICEGCTQLEKSASGMDARFCGVSIVPGMMQFAVTPLALCSSEIASVMRMTAAFEAA